MVEGGVSVVGLVGGECFGTPARRAVESAEVLVGSARHLVAVAGGAPGDSGRGTKGVEQIEIAGPLSAVVDSIAERTVQHRKVCVLASGDPGFFGIVRRLAERFGPEALAVHPAPSSVSLAFARVGVAWDDAEVVSAHGRPLTEAAQAALGPKVAVLTSPDNPPEALGKVLLEHGCGPRQAAVVSRIGEAGEAYVRTDLEGLAGGTFDPMSVVVLTVPSGAVSPGAGPSGAVSPGAGPAKSEVNLRWGLPEEAFEHRNRMITKSEVRAAVLGHLALPPVGVLWDIGAGSGSVAVECARLSPGLKVIAVERSAADAARIRHNATAHGVAVEVVEGEAPAALKALPAPDRVFVGGGGLDALDVALQRLKPSGVVVASYALVDRAVQAWRRLGNMSQISVSRAVPLGEDGVRLSSENPVFVCWGPPGADGKSLRRE